jgi:predicted nucleotidyltransferase
MIKIQNSKQIKSHSNAELAKIFKKQKVVSAYLFGSQAKDKVGPLSDIDIAISFGESVKANERFDLRLETLGQLTDLFKTDKIDLVVLNDAPPLLSHRILKEGILIFSDNNRKWLEFEVKAVLKYLDWKPYLEKYTKEVFG